MLRFLRIYRLGCIAISFAFLVLHAREPLRLNVGDPWEMSINDFTATQCVPAKRVSSLVPQRSVREGVNIITFAKKWFGPIAPLADVVSLAIEAVCESAR